MAFQEEDGVREVPELHWLTPVGERLARAEEIACSAKDLVQSYEESGRAKVVPESTGNELLLRLRLSAPPPPRLPLLVGEAIHQLRASLDNLMVLLADRSASRHLTTYETRHLQFPICSTPSDFEGSKHRLRGIGDDYISRIEEVQPYNLLKFVFGDPVAITHDSEPLSQLRELSNHDKHRRIHLVIHRASGMEVHHDHQDPAPHMELSKNALRDGDIVGKVWNAAENNVHATVELMVEHPTHGQPIRLDALLSRLIWMLSSEVIPHITGDRHIFGHPYGRLPSLD